MLHPSRSNPPLVTSFGARRRCLFVGSDQFFVAEQLVTSSRSKPINRPASIPVSRLMLSFAFHAMLSLTNSEKSVGGKLHQDARKTLCIEWAYASANA
jgi:hypothetical protein